MEEAERDVNLAAGPHGMLIGRFRSAVPRLWLAVGSLARRHGPTTRMCQKCARWMWSGSQRGGAAACWRVALARSLHAVGRCVRASLSAAEGVEGVVIAFGNASVTVCLKGASSGGDDKQKCFMLIGSS